VGSVDEAVECAPREMIDAGVDADLVRPVRGLRYTSRSNASVVIIARRDARNVRISFRLSMAIRLDAPGRG
jgi:hypothetical protein